MCWPHIPSSRLRSAVSVLRVVSTGSGRKEGRKKNTKKKERKKQKTKKQRMNEGKKMKKKSLFFFIL
jgi:hypothetical protein